MSASKTIPTRAQVHVGPRPNPDHPSWNLPLNVAYEATLQERAEVRRRGAAMIIQAREASKAEAIANEATSAEIALANITPTKLSVPSPSTLQTLTIPSAAAAVEAGSPAGNLGSESGIAPSQGRGAYIAERGALWREKGVNFVPRVLSAEQWEKRAKRTALLEGCTEAEAMRRNGFISDLLSLPNEFNQSKG